MSGMELSVDLSTNAASTKDVVSLTSARSRDMEVETLRFVAPVFDPRRLVWAGCSTTLSLGLGAGCNLSNSTGKHERWV